MNDAPCPNCGHCPTCGRTNESPKQCICGTTGPCEVHGSPNVSISRWTWTTLPTVGATVHYS